jgi:hypothetical protein
VKRLCIALCTISVITPQLAAQRGGIHGGGGRPIVPFRQGFGRTNFTGQHFGDASFIGNGRFFGNFGSLFPWTYPAFYWDEYGPDGLWARTVDQYFAQRSLPPEPSQEPPSLPPPPTPPPTPLIREYHWPDETRPPAAFSIVTTAGAEYLATMVWVEGDTIRFNSVDGGVRQIPRSQVSRSLTRAANAQKHLNLPLP